MNRIKAIWNRPEGKGSVEATIVSYAQSSNGEGSRPVAIVVENETGKMAFVDLRYLTVLEDLNAST